MKREFSFPSARRTLAFLVVLIVVSWLAGAPMLAATEHDDCDSDFLAYVGADTYQFSPAHSGELGRVRLFSVLSFQETTARKDYGRAYWRLEVRNPKGATVRTAEGAATIDASGQAAVEYLWDGRDDRGHVVPAGTYRYEFLARFLSDRARAAHPQKTYSSYADLASSVASAEAVEARSSEDSVVVAPELTEAAARSIRESLAAGACQMQQNTPIEAGFGYNFYYGSTHSHSNWSDGGQPTTSCTSGSAYGSGTFNPTAVYDFARNSGGVDFWVINEHNHLIQDAIATNDPPVTEAKVRARYAAGLAAANAASVPDQFVALYGMEWGVTTNSDQGHVTLLETPKLLGWETCTTCNGPNDECTAGSNCYFDVFTPKRFGYLTLYRRSIENPSSAGALGILCHPSTGQFDNYAHNADADEALQGIAIRSGLAFSTTATCAEANVATTDYSARWRDALNRGFHLGPVADHDAHCNNFGAGIPNRTVYLLPNGTAPVLTKPALLAAHKARRFFATEDANAQLVFTTQDGTHVLGESFSAAGGVSLRAAVYDPGAEAVSTIEIWRGQIGGGVPTVAYRTASNQGSIALTESLTAGTYYYYVHAVQADGHDLWSAPMWITYTQGGCSDATAPTVAIVAPAAGAAITCADAVVETTASDAGGIASVQVRVDGGAWNAATFDSVSGRWKWNWASSGATTGSHTLEARATDASCGANVGLSAPISVTVDNASCGLDLSGWHLVQRNSAITYTFPAGTKILKNGYLIVGRDATKAAFETFWRAGTPLPSNVIYLNTAGAIPQINGSEDYLLTNVTNTTVDGRTIAMASAAGTSVRRKDPCQAANLAASWTVGTASTATPGTGAGAGCAKGVVINEFSDATGTGNFVYEFVELHYDQ